MERQTFLTGTLVDLVLFEMADAPLLASWMNDANVTQYLSRGDEPMTLQAETGWIEGLYKRPDDLTLGIWHTADQKLIGSTGLHAINQRDQHATFGIVIGDQEYWGGGCGTDALQTLLQYAFTIRNLKQVRLEVLASNERARRCYETCGFTRVGTIPEAIFKGGRWHDIDIMIAMRT